MNTCHCTYVGSDDSLWEAVLYLHHVGPRNQLRWEPNISFIQFLKNSHIFLNFLVLFCFLRQGHLTSYPLAGQPPASASLMVGSLLGVCHTMLLLESTAFIT